MEKKLKTEYIAEDESEESKLRIENKNDIKDSIKSLFKRRDCKVLCRPINEGKPEAEWDDMKLEFKMQVENLISYVLQEAPYKEVGNC